MNNKDILLRIAQEAHLQWLGDKKHREIKYKYFKELDEFFDNFRFFRCRIQHNDDEHILKTYRLYRFSYQFMSMLAKSMNYEVGGDIYKNDIINDFIVPSDMMFLIKNDDYYIIEKVERYYIIDYQVYNYHERFKTREHEYEDDRFVKFYVDELIRLGYPEEVKNHGKLFF